MIVLTLVLEPRYWDQTSVQRVFQNRLPEELSSVASIHCLCCLETCAVSPCMSGRKGQGDQLATANLIIQNQYIEVSLLGHSQDLQASHNIM